MCYWLGPIYLQELLKEYEPARNLRSSTQLRLTTSITSTQYGQRSSAASELWNDLLTLAQFKSSFKTHLFTLAF